MAVVVECTHYERGFMLWEVVVTCAFLAIMLQGFWSLSLSMFAAHRHAFYQQAAQQWALSIADRLAAGYSLTGTFPLTNSQLPLGVACLHDHPPWQLISIRWAQEGSRVAPACLGSWPPAQQLCLEEGHCS